MLEKNESYGSPLKNIFLTLKYKNKELKPIIYEFINNIFKIFFDGLA